MSGTYIELISKENGLLDSKQGIAMTQIYILEDDTGHKKYLDVLR